MNELREHGASLAGTQLSDAGGFDSARIAILIPCYNEAVSIATVVSDFKALIPRAMIYVYDNNSSDDTEIIALAAGALVRREPRQGKGNVMRRMFADIEADVYVMVDGDDTYDVSAAVPMIRAMIENRLDLVNARRVASHQHSYRAGHVLGNRILSRTVSVLFGSQVVDMLSGFKIMSRRFVKSFPCLTTGFEIETELTVHALELRMPVAEFDVSYHERKPGSVSKLHTIKDGIRILSLISKLIRTERPVIFFGSIFIVLATASLSLGLLIYWEWLQSGLVLRIPTAILCTGMMILAFLSAACGTILETVTLGRREQKRMMYLSR